MLILDTCKLTCIVNLFIFSPGVIITEIHKRGGMSEEDYAKVSNLIAFNPLGKKGERGRE